jgi:predicted RNase H-like HicB family nuclease
VDRYGIAIFWSEEDNQFISIAPDLRGCSASGDTYEEALSEIQIAKELWLELSRKRDYEVPEPRWRPAEAIQVAD